jgi:polyisoprenoid-binding protein YceI
MEGVLQFHGTKKTVELEFEKVGEGPARGGGTVAGFHTSFTIDRSDYGMDYMKGGLGENVEITVSLEAVAK